MRALRFLILLAGGLALSASAGVFISSKGTVGPGGPPPPDPWTFAEIADDVTTGTSGSCIGSDCVILAKGETELQGAMLHQDFESGDAQIIACFSGFTGTPGNFSAAGVGIGKGTSPFANWSRIIKRQAGRIVGRYMPAAGGTVIGTQGDDETDTEPCFAQTLDYSTQRFQSFKTADATGDPLGDEWELVQTHQGQVAVSDPYIVYLWCLSNDADVLLGCPFTNVQVSHEITINAEPPPTFECSDGVDNLDPEDVLADELDPGCGDPYDPLDNDERNTPLPEAQCDDGEDNEIPPDGDIDFPDDDGCTDALDDTENTDNDPCVIDPQSCEPPGQTDFDFTYQGAWSTADKNVYGHNFNFPPSAAIANTGGVFAGNNEVPYGIGKKRGGWKPRRLKNVEFDWRDVEPTDGGFTWTAVNTAINSETADYNGVLFEMLGMVTTAKKPCSAAASTAFRTAPDFIANNPAVYPQIVESCNTTADALITQLKMDDTQLLQQYRAMTASFATAGPGGISIAANPRFEAAILHAAGSTSGEEFTGKQKNECLANGTTTNCGVDAWACTHGNDQDCILDAWFDAYGGNNSAATNFAYKGGMVTDQPDSLYERWVTDLANGFGTKGYNIEFWLGGASHGDEQKIFGWIWEASGVQAGHGHIDETHLLHSSDPPRHFQTQNENYCKGEGNLTAEQWNDQRYRYAIFRLLAMHFTIVWIESCNYLNPKLTHWMGMQLGHTADTADIAWVSMLRTWRWGAALEEVNNLARYLEQYDTGGQATTPTLRVPWGDQPNGVAWTPGKRTEIPVGNRVGDLAREGAVVGITVDDDFMDGDNSGAGFDVAVLVTYFDDNNTPWTMEYTNAAGGTTVKTVDEVPGAGNQQETPASQQVRTQQFCLTDFTAPETGATTTDFRLKSPGGVTPFMMVQLDKTTAGCN